MKVKEYLKALPVGEVVNDKRILAIFKRKGFIYDYSQCGYLESQWVYYNDSYDNSVNHDFTYAGTEIKDGDLGSNNNPFNSIEDLYNTNYCSGLNFEYDGMTFESKYLHGCFNAYLIKSHDSDSTQEVNRTMSVFGSII